MKTELKDRTLWFDGTNQINPDLVPDLLIHGVPPEFIVVNGSNEDVDQFNSLTEEVLEFGKVKNRVFDMTWKIPDRYKKMDLESKVYEELDIFLAINDKRIPEENTSKYKNRVKEELEEIKIRGMEPLIKTLIYVVDRFKETNTIWGVGRGSSCASLVLFLIGLHKVDPIKYKIAISEFFHD